MKRFIAVLAAVAMLLLLVSPVLAASLGLSPSHIELEVPADGSTTADFKVHYFSGDLQVSLVDIPLEVEPETLHIEPSGEPVEIELTIYGDESLGSLIYDGYIRFLGMSGETVAVAVKVKATVTNLVEGETPVPATPEEPQPPPEEAPPEATEPAPPEQEPPAPPAPPAPQAETEGFPIIPVAIIAAVTAIVISIVVVRARRRRY